MSEANRPVEIFFSYSHCDEDLRDELEKHLAALKRESIVDTWHDRRIGAGREWAGEIDRHLESADVILLLISPDFIASDYCIDLEMKRALERHAAGEARVIPVILRPADWRTSGLAKLQALPRDGKALTTWSDRDTAFVEVAQGIRSAIVELRRHRAKASETQRTVSDSEADTERATRWPEKGDRTAIKKTWFVIGIVAMLLLGVGYAVFERTRAVAPSTIFDEQRITVGVVGRLNVQVYGGRTVGVDHLFRTGDFFQLEISSSQSGWIYVFHQRPGGEMNLLWPPDRLERVANAVRAYQPLVVPTDGVAFQFADETGEERFQVVLTPASEAPTPEAETASELTPEDERLVRSFGQSRNVIIARPTAADPNLYFKAAEDGRAARVGFSLRHGEPGQGE